MKKLWVAFLLAALACAEQRVNKIVPVKNVNPTYLYERVRTVTPGLNMTQVQNSIVLTGPEDLVAAAEQLIKMLDVPEPKLPDIEITGYIILATQQAAAEGRPLPSELDPVVKQFRNLLPYKSFRVLDTIILRGKANSAMGAGGLLAVPSAANATTEFRVGHPSVADDAVTLKDLSLYVHLPTSRVNDKGHIITNDVHIGTDTDVKIGQKVAIGKASIDANGDALILVVSANVVN